MVDDADLLGMLRTPEPPPPFVETGHLTRETVQAAVAKLRDTYYVPSMTAPRPIHPHVHDAVNDLLQRPRGTPVTLADMSRAQQVLYDRCTPEERDRLVAMTLGSAGW